LRNTLLSKRDKISAVIFDIDGTLVDSFPAYYSSFNKGISEFKLEPVPEDFLANCLKKGLSLGEILRMTFPASVEESTIERCKREILAFFLRTEADEVKPFPEVNQLFKNLKDRGIKIGIASGRMSIPDDEWIRFRRFGVGKLIDAIVTSREVESRKPAPDIIIECARRLNTPIEECVAVGDTEADIIAARRAGAISAAIASRQNKKESFLKGKPEVILNNLNDLIVFMEDQEMNR